MYTCGPGLFYKKKEEEEEVKGKKYDKKSVRLSR